MAMMTERERRLAKSAFKGKAAIRRSLAVGKQ
jgi:hypothetical protein